MANIYVRSTDGSNSDNGTTWALAKLDLAGAAAIDVAGDTVYMSHAHAESTASTITIALAGTSSAPVKIICVNDAAEPPTAVATTGQVSTTGSSNIALTGNCYIYGVIFSVGGGSAAAPGFLMGGASSQIQMLENCSIRLAATGTSLIALGDDLRNDCSKITFKNCTVRFAGAGQRIKIAAGFEWSGGSVLAGGTAPASLFLLGTRALGGTVLISGVDLSNLGTGFHIFDNTVSTEIVAKIRNCKLPASWTGNLWSSAPTSPGMRAEMHNCDSADTHYRLWVEDYAGSIKTETTLVRTDGASDGVTPISWKMSSSANVSYPSVSLVSPELPARWNSSTGSSVTVTVDVLRDSATNLTDEEIWLEVQYLGTSGFPLSSFISDAKADVLATAADQTTSSATWTTTGMSNPNKQKLSVTFTPQEAGYIQARVFLAKASTTVYVDPKLQVS